MAKLGILHDYDLMANAEQSAQEHTCVVCLESPTRFQWSDYSGEGMCQRCGTPYQLKWGSSEQKTEGRYPYLSVKDEWVPVLRRYYEETGKWVCHGMMLNGHPTRGEFGQWVDDNKAEPTP